ncbi:NADH-quinone oxidoreductase subunit N [Gorillibacterium sp. CAU 1737]|uniref:NADH-quinone oxidoreductase subunit N n=1 Tax=Gorillibacterium sp. CAU 1737 TaxID=3140362 RepID=UPI00326113BD
MDTSAWSSFNAGDMLRLAPELLLLAGFALILLLDLFLPTARARQVHNGLALAVIAVAAGLLLPQFGMKEPLLFFGGSYRIDPFSSVMKLLLLGGTGLILLLSRGVTERERITAAGEYHALLLSASLGALVMVSSTDLITLYIGLETLSLSSSVLAGIRRRDRKANEGAFKLFLQGGIASAIILYGMSLLYGISGSTRLDGIRESIRTVDPGFIPLLYAAAILLLVGIGVKLAAAPFHDGAIAASEGASPPIAAFHAVIGRGAGIALLLRLFYGGFYGQPVPEGALAEGASLLAQDAFQGILVLAVLSTAVGNLLALRQTNGRRLLAYAGVAGTGCLLLPAGISFSTVSLTSLAELVYAFTAYLLMMLGSYAGLMIVERLSGNSELSGFSGLYYRSPGTAAALLLVLLSLAGLPVTAGFFSKLFLLFGAVQLRMYGIALFMAVASVLALVYVFRLIRQMFLRGEWEASPNANPNDTIPWTLKAVLWGCAITGVLLGLFPQMLLGPITNIFKRAMDFF